MDIRLRVYAHPLSSSKFLILNMVSLKQLEKGIAEKELVLAVIETPAHFVKVGRKMFRRDFMPRSNHAALEQRECRFDRVGINPAVRVPLLAVVDGHMFVFELASHRAIIGGDIIRNDELHIIAHVLVNDLVQRVGFHVANAGKAQFAVTLANANDDIFLAVWPSDARLAADVSFINLHYAVHIWLVDFLHGRSDAMAEIPSRLTADSQHPLKL